MPIGTPRGNVFSTFISLSGGLESRVSQRKTLLMCCCMQTQLKSRARALQYLKANGFECARPEISRQGERVRTRAVASLEARNISSGIWDPMSYYDALLGAKFVASPIGYGRDCYRTWEALALGTIPVLEESTQTGAEEERAKYGGLPIIWVRRWDLVTPAFLRSQWEQILANIRNNPNAYDMGNAFLPRWMARLQRKNGLGVPTSTSTHRTTPTRRPHKING